MFKAEHERMFQEANQGIIEIRKSEIDFYLRVAAALGTQAALVGGFSYLTFSQNLEAHYVYTYYVNAVYYVTAGMTVAFAIHVMLNTMLVQILGPGLALNGPVGSMARAVEGMRIEQKQILGSFFIMMSFFATSTLHLFWVTMDVYSAVASTIGFAICARYWFFYCGRIYRRFYWDRKESAMGNWRSSSMESSDEPTLPIPIGDTNTNPMTKPEDIEMGSPPSLHILESHERPTLFERISMVGGVGRGSIIDRISHAIMPGALKRTDPMTEIWNHRVSTGYQERESYMSSTRPSLMVNPKAVACEGFVIMNIPPKSLLKDFGPSRNKWERRYVVLNYRGDLFYYKSKQDFKLNAHAHINPRPLSLENFFVSTEKHDADNVTVVAVSDTGAEKFWFTLVPKEDEKYRNWQYRTDTEEELVMWLQAMRQVSPASFR